jgi:uncharacterized protein YecE (DUF72 family)
MSGVRIGCCGFPTGRRSYYLHLPCVEVQQTFYHPPTIETIDRWRQEAPEGFEFTIKAWQLITHTPQSPTYRRLRMKIPKEKTDRYGSFRPTAEVFTAWEVTRQAAETLQARVIIFQTPPSFRSNPEHTTYIKEFFREIDRGEYCLGWEPRGWDEREAERLCQDLALLRIGDPFHDKTQGEGIAYWRLHGIQGYRYRYSDDDLVRLQQWALEQGDVYVMFNNSSMFQDALRFKALGGREKDGGEPDPLP